METQRVVEFPHRIMDKRPRKRPRLTWDMPPTLPPPKVISAAAAILWAGNGEWGDSKLRIFEFLLQGCSSSWRSHDNDGHYVFGIGKSLTPRYSILSKMDEGSINTPTVFLTAKQICADCVPSCQKHTWQNLCGRSI